jgi:hypothetical protein
MNAIVEHVGQPTAAVAADTQALISAIERAASNPRINLDKMDRLLAMQERILSQHRESIFNTAMAAAQAEMGRVNTDARNDQTHSLYATYAAIDRALRPIYTKHGFGLSFDEADSPKPDHVRVVCLVTHVGGYSRLYHRDMPADGKGAKGGDVMTKTHAVGSAQSYGMRYLVKGIFNVAIGADPEDMDDDGNAAGGREPQRAAPQGKPATQAPRSTGNGTGRCTGPQATMLKKRIDNAGIPEREFYRKFEVSSVEELPFTKVDEAVAWIRGAGNG